MGPADIPASMPVANPATTPRGAADPAKLHRVAKQFEAMFMAEMLHQAHPKPQTKGMFRTGAGEDSMQPFMDQALGDAVAAHGGTGLAKSIERALGIAASGGNSK
jgi:flagellar protein FlgJ